MCPLGTDCADCGPRSVFAPPASPLAPPDPPSTPPLPPPYPLHPPFAPLPSINEVVSLPSLAVQFKVPLAQRRLLSTRAALLSTRAALLSPSQLSGLSSGLFTVCNCSNYPRCTVNVDPPALASRTNMLVSARCDWIEVNETRTAGVAYVPQPSANSMAARSAAQAQLVALVQAPSQLRKQLGGLNIDTASFSVTPRLAVQLVVLSPISPPPPSPPSPPMLPPGIFNSSGGFEPFCLTCSAGCFAEAIAQPEKACFESLWSGGECTDNCNTYECDHRYCTNNEISTKCLADLSQSPAVRLLSQSPRAAAITAGLLPPSNGSSVTTEVHPVSMAMQPNPMRFKVDDDGAPGDVQVNIRVAFSLQWTDPRLFDSKLSPCRRMLPIQLSASLQEAAAQANLLAIRARQAIYWLPEPQVMGIRGASTALLESSFAMNETQTWLGGTGAPGGWAAPLDACVRCVNFSMVKALTFTANFDYAFYPFDSQTVDLSIAVSSPGVHLYTCATVGRELAKTPKQLLPVSGTWQAHSKGGSEWLSAANVNELDEQQIGSCRFKMHIRRSFVTVLIKDLIPGVLVVFSCLCGLWLNPSVPPLLGGRCSMQIFGMLLVGRRSGIVDSLGTLPYLIWVDWFNLIQFVIIICCLMETVSVHHLIRTERGHEAHYIDGIFRRLIPFVIFPIVVLSLLFVGILESWIVWYPSISMVLIIGIVVPCHQVRQDRLLWREKKADAIAKLAKCDSSTDEGMSSIQVCFELCDTDSSGTLDTKELRSLIAAMYPGVPRRVRFSCMSSVLEGMRSSSFGLVEFVTIVDKTQKFMAEAIAVEPPRLARRNSSISCRRNSASAPLPNLTRPSDSSTVGLRQRESDHFFLKNLKRYTVPIISTLRFKTAGRMKGKRTSGSRRSEANKVGPRLEDTQSRTAGHGGDTTTVRSSRSVAMRPMGKWCSRRRVSYTGVAPADEQSDGVLPRDVASTDMIVESVQHTPAGSSAGPSPPPSEAPSGGNCAVDSPSEAQGLRRVGLGTGGSAEPNLDSAISQDL